MKFLTLLFLALTLIACSGESTSQDSVVNVEVVENTPPAESAIPVEKAVLVKFFDYACGHCKDSHYTLKNLKTEFGDKLEVTLKHFPLSAQTYLVAETAECARRQDKFESYHDKLFEENFQRYEPENLQAVAQSVGLNMEEFNTCVANGGGRSNVQADVDEAKALGVSGTPYFLINDTIPLPGAIPESSFSRLIQGVLDGEVL